MINIIYIIFILFLMGKLKNIFLPVLVSLFLIPLSISFAQEDEVTPYGTEEDDSVIYESGPVDEDVVLDDTETENLYDDGYTAYPEFTPTDYPTDDSGIAAFLAAISIRIWFVSIVIGLASYIFMSYTIYKIGKEMGYENSWFAWIPILQSIMIFKLGNQNPNLLFLLLIPGIGGLIVSIFSLIALMNITEKRGYDKLLGLLILTGIGTYILLYLLAWKPKTTTPNQPVYGTEATPAPEAPPVNPEPPVTE